MNPSSSRQFQRAGSNLFKLAIAIGVSLSAGVIGSFFTVSTSSPQVVSTSSPQVVSTSSPQVVSTSSPQAVTGVSEWYAGIVKPALNPPSWIFGPVWTMLYVLMGVAAFLVWSAYDTSSARQEQRRIKAALLIFGIQLFFNAAWSVVFFGLQSPGWALVNIAALWLSIVWTMVLFYKISRPAAYLLAPYLLWVSFASYLNYAIWVLN